MKNIGNIKTKLLGKLITAYSNDQKSEIKDIINLIKENKEFVELYLFYEEIEKKHIEDREVAKEYIDEITPILKERAEKVSQFCDILNKKIGSVLDESVAIADVNVPIYADLDVLLETDNLSNIDKKLVAKKNILKHLLTEKENDVTENPTLVQNENLYHALLVGNFNLIFENELTEDEKKELKEFIVISDQEINTRTQSIKEEILSKVSTLLTEDADSTLQKKLDDVKNEVSTLTPTKYNLYRLVQLNMNLGV